MNLLNKIHFIKSDFSNPSFIYFLKFSFMIPKLSNSSQILKVSPSFSRNGIELLIHIFLILISVCYSYKILLFLIFLFVISKFSSFDIYIEFLKKNFIFFSSVILSNIICLYKNA